MNVPAPLLKLNLESLYLATAVKLSPEGLGAHSVRLSLTSNADDSEYTGTLQLDPNACSLNAFGDREVCTKMAVHGFKVRVTLMRLGDPKHLGRSFYAVHGEGLPPGLSIILYPHRERIYLKSESELVALFLDDGA